MLDSIKTILAFLKAPTFESDSVKAVLDAVGSIYANLAEILAFNLKMDEPGLDEALEELALQCKVAQAEPAKSGAAVISLIIQLVPIILEFLKARK